MVSTATVNSCLCLTTFPRACRRDAAADSDSVEPEQLLAGAGERAAAGTAAAESPAGAAHLPPVRAGRGQPQRAADIPLRTGQYTQCCEFLLPQHDLLTLLSHWARGFHCE